MSTVNIANAHKQLKKNVLKTIDGKQVFTPAGTSIRQYKQGGTFSAPSVGPNSQTHAEFSFDTKNTLEQTLGLWIVGTLKTTDATNHMVLRNNIYSFFHDMY